MASRYVAAVGASYAFPLSPPLHKGLLALGPTDGGTVVVSSPVSRSPPSSYVTLLSTVRGASAAAAVRALLPAGASWREQLCSCARLAPLALRCLTVLL